MSYDRIQPPNAKQHGEGAACQKPRRDCLFIVTNDLIDEDEFALPSINRQPLRGFERNLVLRPAWTTPKSSRKTPDQSAREPKQISMKIKTRTKRAHRYNESGTCLCWEVPARQARTRLIRICAAIIMTASLAE